LFLHNRKLLSSSERSAISRVLWPAVNSMGVAAEHHRNLSRFDPRKIIAHPAKKM
jgi:hypothetical protein